MPMEMEGMNQLLRQIQQMGRTVDTQTKNKALKKSAEHVKAKIEASVPVRTGKLKANIVISDVKDEKIHIGPNQQGPAFYGHFLEFGTSKTAAQPFMGPAYANSKNRVEQIMADVVRREMGL